MATQVGFELAHRLGELLGQRQDRHLDRRQCGMEAQHRARVAALELFFRVRVDEQRQRSPVHPHGGLDHHRHEAFLGGLDHHGQILARVLAVTREIPVTAIVNAFDFLPAEGEQELHVSRGVRIVGELVGFVWTMAGHALGEAQVAVEAHSLVAPVLEPLLALGGVDEELHLRLFELPRAEGEVSRCDLVAEGLADLTDPEGHLLACRLANALEVGEDRLAGLGTQERDRRGFLRRPDLGLQHQVERHRVGQIVLGASFSRIAGTGFVELVCAKALLAGPAVDHRVREVVDVARGFPGARVANDAAVYAHDIGTFAHHTIPPNGLQVVLELDAQRAVVPEPVDAAVDLARLKDEAAPRAQRHDLLDGDGVALRRGIRRR